MTEFPGIDGDQIAYEVTGLTATAEEVIAAPPGCRPPGPATRRR
jgi:hypothetical protein